MNRFALLLVLLLCSLGETDACECKHPGPTVQRALEQADIVFVGNVISLRGSNRLLLATFEVFDVLKGDVLEVYEVRTSPAKCGFQFTEDHSYLVFANLDAQGNLVTDACSRTIWLPKAEKVVVELRDILTLNK